jgi:hypothetical protein
MEAKRRERVLMIGAAVCVALLLGNMLVVKPLTAHWKANQEAIDKLTMDIRRGEALLDRERGLNAEWDQMTSRTLAADQAQASRDVINAVERWTSDSGFNRSSLNPRWTTDSRERDRAEYEVRITGQGTNSQIARFLYLLETDPLPLKIEEARISSSDPNGRTLALSLRFTAVQLRIAQNTRGAGGRAPLSTAPANQ